MRDLIEQDEERLEHRGFLKRRRVWTWVVAFLLILVVVAGVIGEVMVHRAMPILKGRIIETLSTQFNSELRWMGLTFRW